MWVVGVAELQAAALSECLRRITHGLQMQSNKFIEASQEERAADRCEGDAVVPVWLRDGLAHKVIVPRIGRGGVQRATLKLN